MRCEKRLLVACLRFLERSRCPWTLECVDIFVQNAYFGDPVCPVLSFHAMLASLLCLGLTSCMQMPAATHEAEGQAVAGMSSGAPFTLLWRQLGLPPLAPADHTDSNAQNSNAQESTLFGGGQAQKGLAVTTRQAWQGFCFK